MNTNTQTPHRRIRRLHIGLDSRQSYWQTIVTESHVRQSLIVSNTSSHTHTHNKTKWWHVGHYHRSPHDTWWQHCHMSPHDTQYNMTTTLHMIWHDDMLDIITRHHMTHNDNIMTTLSHVTTWHTI